MKGINGLLGSKKAMVAILILTCATVLVGFERIDPEAWIGLVKWIGGFFIAGQAVSDGMERLGRKTKP